MTEDQIAFLAKQRPVDDTDVRAVHALRAAGEYAAERIKRVIQDPAAISLAEENVRLRKIITAQALANGEPLKTCDRDPATGETGMQTAAKAAR